MSRKPLTHRIAMSLLVLGVCGGSAAAQTAGAGRGSRAMELSKAWGAVASGDYRVAETIASELLKRAPADHAAVQVGIAAVAASGRATAALDVYERWLQRSGSEDMFLLEPIAVATLSAIAQSKDAGAAADALTALSRYAPDTARALLERRGATESLDGVRARLGDATASARLLESLSSVAPLIKLHALRELEGVTTVDPAAIAKLLDDPAPPVRAAAAETLVRNEGEAARARVRPLLKDPDPFVRSSAAVALGRLRDPEATEILMAMAESPVGDTAAMAAAVLKELGQDVTRIAERILADENPLTRLSAIPLLADADRARAEALLRQATRDNNPVIRGRAAAILAAAATTDPALLRALLRDADGDVRIHAATSLLRLTAPRP